MVLWAKKSASLLDRLDTQKNTIDKLLSKFIFVFFLKVQENIQKILKNLSQFKESEASAPFAPQIESLEVRLNETTKKINLVTFWNLFW